MSQPGASEDLYVASRSALIDALHALGPHARHTVVIGAQAIYLRTGGAAVAIAEATKDSDLAVDPRAIPDTPLIEDAMRSGGFLPHPSNQPGMWVNGDNIPVDLMTPEALDGPSGSKRRGWRNPPHARTAVRRARGIEATLIDHGLMRITALDPTDPRVVEANVAGPTALIVAKTHKIAERITERDRASTATPNRVQPKDAHDIYRILQAIDTDVLADRMRVLLATDLSSDVTAESLDQIRTLFSTPTSEGVLLAGVAESGVGDPDLVANAFAILVNEFLAELA